MYDVFVGMSPTQQLLYLTLQYIGLAWLAYVVGHCAYHRVRRQGKGKGTHTTIRITKARHRADA